MHIDEELEKKIHQLILTTLREDFNGVEILDVVIDHDQDADDDDVLRIDVVFRGRSKDIDSRKISGAVRKVRPGLQKLGEMAFPLFSFVSQGDAGRHLETA